MKAFAIYIHEILKGPSLYYVSKETGYVQVGRVRKMAIFGDVQLKRNSLRREIGCVLLIQKKILLYYLKADVREWVGKSPKMC